MLWLIAVKRITTPNLVKQQACLIALGFWPLSEELSVGLLVCLSGFWEKPDRATSKSIRKTSEIFTDNDMSKAEVQTRQACNAPRICVISIKHAIWGCQVHPWYCIGEFYSSTKSFKESMTGLQLTLTLFVGCFDLRGQQLVVILTEHPKSGCRSLWEFALHCSLIYRLHVLKSLVSCWDLHSKAKIKPATALTPEKVWPATACLIKLQETTPVTTLLPVEGQHSWQVAATRIHTRSRTDWAAFSMYMNHLQQMCGHDGLDCTLWASGLVLDQKAVKHQFWDPTSVHRTQFWSK